MARKRRVSKKARKGRRRRGGDGAYGSINKHIKGMGSVLRTLGVGKQVKAARNIASKGALRALSARMGV